MAENTGSEAGNGRTDDEIDPATAIGADINDYIKTRQQFYEDNNWMDIDLWKSSERILKASQKKSLVEQRAIP
jgi:hypothetical protein